MPKNASHTFQAPKGTRDFYPEDMAVRRFIETVWHRVSINHGFEEINGPTFEHLDLYTVKSGPGIVSELFSFRREGGDTDYALRPEFTPTLARMAAARSSSLPVPTRWYSIPDHFRAERPQRGRLREFGQWNVDVIGDPSHNADFEIIEIAIAMLEAFGFSAEQMRLRMSHRGLVTALLSASGIDASQHAAAFELLDRRDKFPPDQFAEKASELGMSDALIEQFTNAAVISLEDVRSLDALDESNEDAASFIQLCDDLVAAGRSSWCCLDLGIVRGLAYYTGMVFEVHFVKGQERAVAGGGRYDQLIELFGGKPTPAVGFAMGDVIVRLLLEDEGLLQEPAEYLPRPDVFVLAASDEAASTVRRILMQLRRAGLHARTTSKATRNVGKLLKDAAKSRAHTALILEDADGAAQLKRLDTGDQESIPFADAISRIQQIRSEQQSNA